MRNLSKKVKKVEKNCMEQIAQAVNQSERQIRDEINSRLALVNRNQQQTNIEMKNAFQDIETNRDRHVEFKSKCLEKIADLGQDLGTEIDKIKIVQNMAKELGVIENSKNEESKDKISFHVMPDEKFGKEHFSLRSQIFAVERKLKSEIQQRTNILAKTQQSELFNIREVLRADRKNLAKVTEIAENTHRETQHDINKLRSQIKKDKFSESEKRSKICQEIVANETENDKKIQLMRNLLDSQICEIRDEVTEDRIDLRNQLKESLEMILAGKISVDRLAARQTKVESGFSKFCKETKATIKYFTDQLEDSD